MSLALVHHASAVLITWYHTAYVSTRTYMFHVSTTFSVISLRIVDPANHIRKNSGQCFSLLAKLILASPIIACKNFVNCSRRKWYTSAGIARVPPARIYVTRQIATFVKDRNRELFRTTQINKLHGESSAFDGTRRGFPAIAR